MITRGTGYEISEYVDANVTSYLGRQGLGYKINNQNGDRVTVVVHDGNLDTRLHEIGEMRVLRQQELMKQGKLPASQEVLSKLKTLSAHQYAADFLGYKVNPLEIHVFSITSWCHSHNPNRSIVVLQIL